MDNRTPDTLSCSSSDGDEPHDLDGALDKVTGGRESAGIAAAFRASADAGALTVDARDRLVEAYQDANESLHSRCRLRLTPAARYGCTGCGAHPNLEAFLPEGAVEVFTWRGYVAVQAHIPADRG